jgi:hypothetical protein
MSRTRNKSVAELLHMAIAGYNSLIAELKERREQLTAVLTGKTKSASVKVVAPKKRSKLSAAARAKISAAQKARWARDRKEKAEEQKLKAAQLKAKPVKAAPTTVKKKVEAQTPKAAQSKAKLIRAASVPIKKKAEQQTLKAAQPKAKLIKAASLPVKEKTELAAPPTVRPVKAALAPAKSKISAAENTKPTKINFARKALAQQVQKIKTPQTPKPDVATPAGIVEQLALAGARFRITRGGSLVIGNLGSLPTTLQHLFLDHPDPHLLTIAARRHLASANQSSKQ